ncbi:MAG: hydrogenase expression/formation protein HypE [Desulfotomaculales bacterium]
MTVSGRFPAKSDDGVILLAHGDGGALTHNLIKELFLKYFRNESLLSLTDAAVLNAAEGRLCLTTDSFVVDPVFFPGGDIGFLSVCCTVNDLAVSGARPRYLTASFVIEEGFALKDLERVVSSMAAACRAAGVGVVAGDTKVVGRGHLDKIFITTTGVGFVPEGVDLGYHRLAPGDLVLVNGSVGNHGLAVLAAREELGLDGRLESDCAPLNGLIEQLFRRFGKGIKIMRDLTRGGLATALKEIAVSSGVDFYISEGAIPVDAEVSGAAEMLGLDPLYLANEGKFLLVIEAALAEAALAVMRGDGLGRRASIIGEVRAGGGKVYLQTLPGGTRLLDLLAGAPLPRIC